MGRDRRGPDRRSFRILPFRPDVHEEIEAELSFHFEETVEALVREGWTEAGARAEARRRFGDEHRYREGLRRIGRRRMRKKRSIDWITRLGQDLRAASRTLWRRPGFSAVVVATLALGIGANATMFGIVDRLLLRPPEHIRDADRVRKVHRERTTRSGEVTITQSFSYPDYRDFVDLPALDAVAAYTGRREWTLGRGTDAERMEVQLVSAGYFPLLGVTPVRGRFFTEEDDTYGAPPTVVLSEALWERGFGGDPDILGRTIELNGDRYEVIGIAPAGFTGVDLGRVDMWAPLHPASVNRGWEDDRAWWWLEVVTRLSDGVDDATAAAQMTTAHRAARRAHEAADPPRISYFERGEPRIVTGSVISARGPDPSAVSSITLWLIGVSAVVLLIACANVANLLLARGVRTRREHAIRVALGIAPGRLAKQLLTEALVLAALGAVAALVVAHWSSSVIGAVLIPEVPVGGEVVSSRFLLFLAVATAVTALMAGVIPALDARRAAAGSGGGLRSASRGDVDGGSKLRSALTVGQTTLAVLLLVGAGLFVRSLWTARSLDLGFDADRTMLVQVEVDADQARQSEIYDRALDAIAGIPAVRAVAKTTGTTPFYGAVGNYLRASGVDSLPSARTPYVYGGTAALFEALGARVIQGRGFRESDFGEGAEPVLMVSERFAEEVWPGLDPLTQCGRVGRGDPEGEPPRPCRRVVGVFGDMVRFRLDEDPAVAYALPATDETSGSWGLIVRTEGAPEALTPAVREAIHGLDDDVRYVDVTTFASMRADRMGSWRLGAVMFSAFGGLALLLAALGLYSVLAFHVVQRRRELGVRAALGATKRDLVGMVASQTGRLLVLGLVAGLTVAFFAGRRLEGLLFRVDASDPTVYVGVGCTLLVVGVIAAVLPAWRVTRVDPTRAIQAE